MIVAFFDGFEGVVEAGGCGGGEERREGEDRDNSSRQTDHKVLTIKGFQTCRPARGRFGSDSQKRTQFWDGWGREGIRKNEANWGGVGTPLLHSLLYRSGPRGQELSY